MLLWIAAGLGYIGAVVAAAVGHSGATDQVYKKTIY